MKDCPLFTVIIPVYKVEPYIRQCIDSVLSQTVTDWEIILVDDGSPDDCGVICDTYARQNTNIQVIHQKNEGLSAARNTGLKTAKGEYIVFLDSDDMLESNALETFSTAINDNRADIYAAYPLCINEEDCSTYPRFGRRALQKAAMHGREFLELGFSQGALEAPAPFNIYRREFLLDHSLYFKVGILHEDERWMPEVFLFAGSVCEVDYTFYLYRIRPGSITTSTKPKVKNALDLFQTCNELETIARKYKRCQVKWLRNHLAMVYMSASFFGRLDLANSSKMDRFFPIRNAYSVKNRAKAVLFAFSPCMYCRIDAMVKRKKV